MNQSAEHPKKNSLNLAELKRVVIKEKKFAWPLVILFFLIIYGYMVLKINNFTQTQPTQIQVSNDMKTTVTPAINQGMVNKLEQMKNNSVGVQALFNQSRSNPFQ